MNVKILVVNGLSSVAFNLKDNDVVLFQWGDSNGAYCRIYSDKDDIIEKFKTSPDFDEHQSVFKACLAILMRSKRGLRIYFLKLLEAICIASFFILK